MENQTKNPIIIAGPCAIETKNQFFETIEQIHGHVDFIRCGVWKARTSPKNYAGKGNESLYWIQSAQKKYNIPFAIEIGTQAHIKRATKHNINTFWIGARTTSNPFSVQEIAEFLKGSDVEIWIKNPIFSEIKLWFGAIERLYMQNIKNIKVIHRGFHSENPTKYRNNPRWDLLKKFKLTYPNTPIILDPSHIAGKRSLISEVVKKGLELGVNGFMLEVHNNPTKALSDKDQQLTPIEFKKLLQTHNLKQPA